MKIKLVEKLCVKIKLRDTITGYNSTLGNKSFVEKRDRQSKDGKRFFGYKNGLEINNEIAKLVRGLLMILNVDQKSWYNI